MWIYNSYEDWMARHRSGTEKVKHAYYKNIYNTCYNIESARPRTNVCDTCFSLTQQIRLAKEEGKDFTELEQKLKLHKEKADIAYKSNYQANVIGRTGHFYNNNKICPFIQHGCKFLHKEAIKCKFSVNCVRAMCPYKH